MKGNRVSVNPQVFEMDDRILAIVRKTRNELIKDFLDERVLLRYLQSQYRVMEMSGERVQRVKAALKKLLSNPIDATHYQLLLSAVEKDKRSAVIRNEEAILFKEIDTLLSKHVYVQ